MTNCAQEPTSSKKTPTTKMGNSHLLALGLSTHFLKFYHKRSSFPKDKTDRIKILSALEDKLDKLDQVTQRTFYGNLNDLIAISEIPFQRPEKIEETEQPDQQVSSIMEQSTQPPPNDTARLLDMLTKKLSNETSQKCNI